MENRLEINVLDEIKSYTHLDDYMDANYSSIDENTTVEELDFSKVRGNVKVMQGEVLLVSEMNAIINRAKGVTFP